MQAALPWHDQAWHSFFSAIFLIIFGLMKNGLIVPISPLYFLILTPFIWVQIKPIAAFLKLNYQVMGYGLCRLARATFTDIIQILAARKPHLNTRVTTTPNRVRTKSVRSIDNSPRPEPSILTTRLSTPGWFL